MNDEYYGSTDLLLELLLELLNLAADPWIHIFYYEVMNHIFYFDVKSKRTFSKKTTKENLGR